MSTKQLTVLCDMDGILGALHLKWLKDFNSEYGTNWSIADIKEWEMHVPMKCEPRAIYSIIERPGYFLDVDPIPGAFEGLKHLHEAGHRIVVLSASSKHAASDKMVWLEKNFPFLSNKNIMLAYSKDLVRGDVLIDDGPHNIISYQAAWPKALIVGIKYPYNEHLQGRVIESAWGTPTPAVLLAHDWQDPAAAWNIMVRRIDEFAIVKKWEDEDV